MSNQILLDQFKKLIEQIKFQIDNAIDKKESMRNHFRLRQINNVIKIIEKYPKKIKSGNDIKHIKGVGKGTIDRIDEILRTGKLSEIKIKTKQKKQLDYIKDLEQVIGIGRKTAYTLVTKHNIKSVKQLKKAYKDKKIELNDKILLGLKYHGKYKQKIPRTEIDKINIFLQNEIKSIDSELNGIICGSYRRNKPFSGDIDLLLTHPSVKTVKQIKSNKNNHLKKLVNALQKNKFLVGDMTDKDFQTKYMGFCQLTYNSKKYPIRRIDIIYVPHISYHPALLYFTGSGEFNQKMRGLAKNLGYQLNQYGLFKLENGKKIRIKIRSEKDIFDVLGMEYLTPEQR